MKKSGVWGFVIALILSMEIIIIGCGSGSTSDYKMADTTANGDNYNVYESAVATEEAYDTSEGNAEQVADNSRKLITTVNMYAETEDLDQTTTEVQNKVKELGGYVESSSLYNGSSYASDNRSVSFTIRIPADKLDQFVTVVEEGTNVTNKSVNVEDVTLEYVDVESRKTALEAEEKRLLEILEEAETVEDIITVESKLTDVRYELESIESQLRTYDNQIDYSTVYLGIDEVKQYTPAEEKGFFQRISEGFVYNLKELGDFFVELIIWVIIHIPQIVIIAAVVAVVFVIRKKRKKKNGK